MTFTAQELIDIERRQRELIDSLSKKDYIDVEFRVIEETPELPAQIEQSKEQQ